MSKNTIPLTIGWLVAFGLSSTGIYIANTQTIEPPLAGVLLWVFCTVPIFAMLMIHRGVRAKVRGAEPMAWWEVHINAVARAVVVFIITTLVLVVYTRAWFPEDLSVDSELLYVASVFVIGVLAAAVSYRGVLRQHRKERTHTPIESEASP